MSARVRARPWFRPPIAERYRRARVDAMRNRDWTYEAPIRGDDLLSMSMLWVANLREARP